MCQVVLGHHGMVSCYHCLNLFEGSVADIDPPDDFRLIGICLIRDDLPALSKAAMAGGTADPSGILIQHLPILEIGDKILTAP